jgi:hypothetical protein
MISALRWSVPTTIAVASAILLTSGAYLEFRFVPALRVALSRQLAVNARLEQRVTTLRTERDAAQSDFAAFVSTSTIDSAPTKASARQQEISEWARRTKALRHLVEQSPDQYIPELALLDDVEWLRVARDPFETADEKRRVFAHLRDLAKNNFVQTLQYALDGYRKRHNGQLPTDILEVEDYLHDSRCDSAMLQRYEMVNGRRNGNEEPPDENYVVREIAVVDSKYDPKYRIVMRPDGSFATNEATHDDYDEPSQPPSTGELTARQAVAAYATAHQGQPPSTPVDLLPYFAQGTDPRLIQAAQRPMTPSELEAFRKETSKWLGEK